MRLFKHCTAIIAFLVLFVQCKPQATHGQSLEGESHQNTNKVSLDKASFEMGRFLGNKGIISNLRLLKLQNSAAYKRYATTSKVLMQKFKQSNAYTMKKWINKNLEKKPIETLFYPFSGPDILNALIFFPQAKNILMAALEPTGKLPNVQDEPPTQVAKGLHFLTYALNEILGLNFFRTNDMKVEIGSTQFNAVTPILMFFIVKSGYDIVKVQNVTLSNQGKLVIYQGSKPNKKFNGSQIFYVPFGKKPTRGNIRNVVFFSGDISDDAMKKRAAWLKFIESYGKVTTFLKAASYLMYRSQFDDVRSLILAHSEKIFFESSGFPFHHLTSNKSLWNIKLYGRYTRPIHLFRMRCQPDLVKAIRKETLGVLPFSFGYNYKKGYSHIIIADRKPNKFITQPKYDHTSKKGIETYCSGGRLIVEKK